MNCFLVFLVNRCKEAWTNLRYDYQLHVRKLRRWVTKQHPLTFRPVMIYENDLIFLWPHIPNRSYCKKEKPKKPENEDVVVVLDDDDPMIIIEIDDDVIEVPSATIVIEDDTTNKDKVETVLLTDVTKQMIQHIEVYPELYDTTHDYFNDSRRKGIIWNSISSEINDKGI